MISKSKLLPTMPLERHPLLISKAPWRLDGHPFNKSNNVNAVDGDPDGDGIGLEVHTRVDARRHWNLRRAGLRREPAPPRNWRADGVGCAADAGRRAFSFTRPAPAGDRHGPR